MPWQSPYRGEESPLDRLSPGVRQWVSRGVMFAVGCVITYVALRGMVVAVRPYFLPAPATQPSGYRHYGDHVYLNVYMWLALIVGAFVGLTMAAAAVVPVTTVERIFRRVRRPPTTGDRSPETDDRYFPLGSRPWWWW